MHDEEVVKIIATKVMGWHLQDHPEKNGSGQWFCEYGYQQWFDADGTMVADHNWRPHDNDEDCMLAWDKISETKAVDLYNGRYVYRDGVGNYSEWYAKVGAIECSHTDRKRAMCECMIKAVK